MGGLIVTRKEEILSAAREYNSGITLSSPSNVLHFEAGAKWADENPPQGIVNLNDMWHDVSEAPVYECEQILCLDKYGNSFISLKYGETFNFDGENLYWNDFAEKRHVTKWLYINNLIETT